MLFKTKKAQVTLFIILAIILISIFGITIYLARKKYDYNEINDSIGLIAFIFCLFFALSIILCNINHYDKLNTCERMEIIEHEIHIYNKFKNKNIKEKQKKQVNKLIIKFNKIIEFYNNKKIFLIKPDKEVYKYKKYTGGLICSD